MFRPLMIDGKRFELTLREQIAGGWHWLISAPGELVLSGDAATEVQALQSACEAARAVARLQAA